FEDKLRVEFIPAKDHYIFPSRLRREKGAKPFSQDVGVWYLVRFGNISHRALSVASIKYREGGKAWIELSTPLVSGLVITQSQIRAKKIVDLPFRMEVGESIDLSMFVTQSVSRELGRYLFEIFREAGNPIDTEIEFILLDPDYFQIAERRILEGLKKGKIAEYVDFGPANISGISADRTPLLRNDEGNWLFRDPDNTSKDGFRFRDALKTYVAVNDMILSSPNDTVRSQESPTETIEFAFQLSSGAVEYITLFRSRMALDQARPTKSDKIF